MKRTVPFVLAGLLAIAGCGGDDEPAAMPTPEDPLTTSSPDDDAATSTAPVEDDTAPTSSPPDEVEETTTPEGADIHEDSEAGAEAFARHYIDLINQTGMEPEEGVLEPLAAEGCGTCANFESNVSYLVENNEVHSGPTLEVTSAADVLVYPDEAVVSLSVEQLAVDVISEDGEVVRSSEATSGTFKFDLIRSGESWLVSQIFAAEGT